MTNTTIRDYKPLAIAGRVPFIPTMLDNLVSNIAMTSLNDLGKIKDIASALDYILVGRGYTFYSLTDSDKNTANCALSCANAKDYYAAISDLRTLDACLLATNRKR